MELFDPYIYCNVHIIIVALISLTYIFIKPYENYVFFYTSYGQNIVVYLYALVFVFFVGLRPLSWAFSDMHTYTAIFNSYKNASDWNMLVDEDKKEWVWAAFTFFMSKLTDVNIYFLVIEALYVSFYFVGITKLFAIRRDMVLLALLGSFSFFAYGTNTIRAGLAMSVVFLSMAYFLHYSKLKWILFLFFSYIAYYCHHSSLLPIISFIVSYYWISTPKHAMYIWLGCLIANLLLGTDTQEFIMSYFDSDVRVQNYLNVDAEMSYFSRIGFRWDFMIYSFMPLLLGWILINKYGVKDKIYQTLLNTYIISNAFWVLVNRASFSDRFAYLSWFLYPFVLMYPLLNIEFKENQANMAINILLGIVGFTFFMQIIYYG